jgi:LPS-assembly lipoprotein
MRTFLIFASLLIVSACGFTPVYGTLGHDKNFGTEDLLALVAIDNIPDREGQFLRNELIDRFYRTQRPSNPQYRLVVSNLTERLRDLDITESSDSTRAQLRIQAQIKLMDSITGETLMERTLHSASSYNKLGSEFATRASEQSTRENVLNALAQRIETQVTLYLKRDVIN